MCKTPLVSCLRWFNVTLQCKSHNCQLLKGCSKLCITQIVYLTQFQNKRAMLIFLIASSTSLRPFMCFLLHNRAILRAIPFSKAYWGRTWTFLGVPTTTIQFYWPPLPAHFKFNITLRNTLCHPLLPHFDLFNTPYPHITNNFQLPLQVTFENGIALKRHNFLK